MKEQKVLLKAEQMRKYFGITHAVKDLDITIYAGEVRTLIGENGSGKSTLSNMFAGVHTMTAGQMELLGKDYKPKNIIDARATGIGLVVQEVGTVDNLTVAENMYMGRENEFLTFGFVDRRKMERAADEALQRVGITNFRGSDLINKLSFENRKLVEVIMVMDADPTIMIFDETTTALSKHGRDLVYSIMKEQKRKGKSIIFISHDLEEVEMVSDRVTIMRDGDLIRTLEKEEITIPDMRKLMIGRDLTDDYYRPDMTSECGVPVISVKNLTCEGLFRDITFDVHEGEIVGLGGLTECGMHEVCRAIFGIIKSDSGEVIHTETGKAVKTTQDALSVKMGYMSKNREVEALMPQASIRDNILLMSYDKAKKGLVISRREEKRIADENREKLSIKCQGIEQDTNALSGGNKQKVVIAKWLANDTKIIIMDCPTRGIDIGVKEAIYKLMYQLKQQKCSIIMVSEEMPELIGMSDKIYVMKDGQISGVFKREDMVTEHDIIEHII